jgi:outer membrane protein, heavy metal efflux system
VRRGTTLACVLVVAVARAVAGQGAAPLPAPASHAFVDPVGGLSLDDAIARALAQEPGLAAARRQIDVARGAERQARLRENPTLTYEQRTEPAGSDAATMLSIEWPLELFRRSARTAVAVAEVEATARGVADRERRLAGDVRVRYGGLLVALRDLDVLDRLVASAMRQRDVLAARVEAGAAAPLDRDLAEVEARRLEADRQLQAGRVEAAVIELERVLGSPPTGTLRVKQPLEAVVATWGTPAVGGRPDRADVQEAAVRVAVADAAIARARRVGRPDVALYGTYTRMDSGFPQMGFGPSGLHEPIRGVFHYAAGGVRVALPLLNRGQGTRAAAEAERAGAAAMLDAARLAARSEVAAARARLMRATEALRLYRDVEAGARRNLVVVQQTQELGRVALLDVLTEQRRYLEIERAHTGAMQAVFEARAALDTALGVTR